jgi:hypothetical protein
MTKNKKMLGSTEAWMPGSLKAWKPDSKMIFRLFYPCILAFRLYSLPAFIKVLGGQEA